MWMFILAGFVSSWTINSDGQFWGICVSMKRLEFPSVTLNVMHITGLPVTVPWITCQTPRNCITKMKHVHNECWWQIDQMLTLFISKFFIGSTSGHCPALNWNAVINEIRKAMRKNEIAIFSRWISIVSLKLNFWLHFWCFQVNAKEQTERSDLFSLKNSLFMQQSTKTYQLLGTARAPGVDNLQRTTSREFMINHERLFQTPYQLSK